MSNPTARRDRQDAMLAELSELGLTLARELHARALAAETPLEADRLALAFQRVSRGVRQTFAMELKVERARRQMDRDDAMEELEDAVRAAQEAEADARAQGGAQGDGDPALDAEVVWYLDSVEARKDRVKGALARLIWTEAEGDEAEIEMLDTDLDARLGEAGLREDFLDMPFETLVRQLKADMDLPGDLRLTACAAPPNTDLPRETAGGGPSAEERRVEGANLSLGGSTGPP